MQSTTKDGFYCPNHILLIGFMGCGKSTAARRIARINGLVSFDVDHGISRMYGKSIPKIFAEEGEAAFRQYEYEYLEYLMDKPPAIISCGGGIVTTQKCRDMLRKLGFVVFMEIDPNEVPKRISNTESRPMLANGADVAELMNQRMPLYLECADMRYDTTGKTSGKVAYELTEELKGRGVL